MFYPPLTPQLLSSAAHKSSLVQPLAPPNSPAHISKLDVGITVRPLHALPPIPTDSLQNMCLTLTFWVTHTFTLPRERCRFLKSFPHFPKRPVFSPRSHFSTCRLTVDVRTGTRHMQDHFTSRWWRSGCKGGGGGQLW